MWLKFPIFFKVYWLPGKFLGNLKKFQKFLFGHSRKFPYTMESFRALWNVSGHSGNFLFTLESWWTLWKVFAHSGKFSKPWEPMNTFVSLRRLRIRIWCPKFFLHQSLLFGKFSPFLSVPMFKGTVQPAF